MITGSEEITNAANIIDSRDIIARIEYLEDIQECATSQDDGLEQDELEELAALKDLADQCEGYGDWGHGEALIADEYFVTYAEQLADDCGMLADAATWPLRHIDWEAAAEELKQDYMYVDFDGCKFWIRSV